MDTAILLLLFFFTSSLPASQGMMTKPPSPHEGIPPKPQLEDGRTDLTLWPKSESEPHTPPTTVLENPRHIQDQDLKQPVKEKRITFSYLDSAIMGEHFSTPAEQQFQDHLTAISRIQEQRRGAASAIEADELARSGVLLPGAVHPPAAQAGKEEALVPLDEVWEIEAKGDERAKEWADWVIRLLFPVSLANISDASEEEEEEEEEKCTLSVVDDEGGMSGGDPVDFYLHYDCRAFSPVGLTPGTLPFAEKIYDALAETFTGRQTGATVYERGKNADRTTLLHDQLKIGTFERETRRLTLLPDNEIRLCGIISDEFKQKMMRTIELIEEKMGEGVSKIRLVPKSFGKTGKNIWAHKTRDPLTGDTKTYFVFFSEDGSAPRRPLLIETASGQHRPLSLEPAGRPFYHPPAASLARGLELEYKRIGEIVSPNPHPRMASHLRGDVEEGSGSIGCFGGCSRKLKERKAKNVAKNIGRKISESVNEIVTDCPT